MQTIFVLGLTSLVLGVFDLNFLRTNPLISESSQTKSDWLPYSEEYFFKASSQSKPIILDFYADWCAACHELDKYVFSSSEFKNATKEVVLLKFDATKDSDLLAKLKKKFQIKGLPTILFFDSKGQWLEKLTLTEFEKKELFLKRLQSLK